MAIVGNAFAETPSLLIHQHSLRFAIQNSHPPTSDLISIIPIELMQNNSRTESPFTFATLGGVAECALHGNSFRQIDDSHNGNNSKEILKIFTLIANASVEHPNDEWHIDVDEIETARATQHL